MKLTPKKIGIVLGASAFGVFTYWYYTHYMNPEGKTIHCIGIIKENNKKLLYNQPLSMAIKDGEICKDPRWFGYLNPDFKSDRALAIRFGVTPPDIKDKSSFEALKIASTGDIPIGVPSRQSSSSTTPAPQSPAPSRTVVSDPYKGNSAAAICREYQREMSRIGNKLKSENSAGNIEGITRVFQEQQRLHNSISKRLNLGLPKNDPRFTQELILKCSDNNVFINGLTREDIESIDYR